VCPRHRAEVLRAAAAYLAWEDSIPTPTPFVVTIETEQGDKRSFCCRLWPDLEQPVQEAPSPGRWLSPIEESIVQALSSGGWSASPQIAKVLQITDLERLKVVLTNLVDRGILESVPGKGYRLAT
jgi:hypothetical protein